MSAYRAGDRVRFLLDVGPDDGMGDVERGEGGVVISTDDGGDPQGLLVAFDRAGILATSAGDVEHEHDDEPRRCVSCGDEPHTLSSRDLCDGCEAERERGGKDLQARDVLAAYVPWADSSERAKARAATLAPGAGPDAAEDALAAHARYVHKAEAAIAAALAVLS